MNLIEYPDADMLAIDLANKLAGELNAALVHDDRVLLAVAGGETPGPIYDDLCAADLDWSRVDIMLTDERWVPEVHVRSNTRMLRERLLVNRAAKARFLPLYAKADAPEDVLPELESLISPQLPVTVLLMGMGEDMHTASLFPGGDNLEQALDLHHAPVLVPMRAREVQDTRISLSARVLNDAISKHLVITGRRKRNALEKARHMAPEKAPVAAVLEGTTVHWAE